MRSIEQTLRIGDQLDERYAELRGEMATSKTRSLTVLARILESARVRYVLIGGVAVQIWSAEPRTTLDIDFAIASYDDLPRAELLRAGFTGGIRFDHSENWTAADGAPVQFSDDPMFADAIATATEHPVGDTKIRIATVVELVRAKLRAAKDPARRRSKRAMDIADAIALAEQYGTVLDGLSPEEKHQLAEGGPPTDVR